MSLWGKNAQNVAKHIFGQKCCTALTVDKIAKKLAYFYLIFEKFAQSGHPAER
jgi:hypothetical protein